MTENGRRKIPIKWTWGCVEPTDKRVESGAQVLEFRMPGDRTAPGAMIILNDVPHGTKFVGHSGYMVQHPPIAIMGDRPEYVTTLRYAAAAIAALKAICRGEDDAILKAKDLIRQFDEEEKELTSVKEDDEQTGTGS